MVLFIRLISCFSMLDLYFEYYEESDDIEDRIDKKCEDGMDADEEVECNAERAISRGMFL